MRSELPNAFEPPAYDQPAAAVGDDVDLAARTGEGASELERVDHRADRQRRMLEEETCGHISSRRSIAPVEEIAGRLASP